MKPMLKSKTRYYKFSKTIDTTISKDAIDVVRRLRGKPESDQNKKCPSIVVRFIARKPGTTYTAQEKN